jgi:hypothetical protein
MQKKAIVNFAQTHGIILGETWYTVLKTVDYDPLKSILTANIDPP